MASDGNCLFRAAARQLYGSSSHHALVRHRIVAQLYRDRVTYGCFFASLAEMAAYLCEMATDCTWGDELALRALADAYGAELHVLTSSVSGFYLLYTPTSEIHQKHFPRIFVGYTYPVHYDGLVSEPLLPEEEDIHAKDAKFARAVVGSPAPLSPGEIFCLGLGGA